MIRWTLPFVALFLQTTLFGQTVALDTILFYSQIKSYNLATIFSADSFLTEGRETDKQWIKRPEPLGYIDTNYTRFYIHFTSATKDKDNPYQYNITGKTKVKNNICDFKGTITITKAKLYPSTESPGFKEGSATCDVLFFEDSTQTGSGFIKGILTSNFYLDKKGRLCYNSLMFIADGFSNNEFVGNWTSYKTKKSKKCNWGDFRIPDSGDLDIGAGEFSPADKYLKNGWQSYRDAYWSDNENIKARQNEETKWWLK